MTNQTSELDMLKTENANLKGANQRLQQQLEQNSQGVEGLLAQLDAHKHIINENMAVGINIRTQIIMLNKQNQELMKKIQTLQNTINSLNQQLADATSRIASLESPQDEVKPEVQESPQ